jgi:hypothetical protein
MSLEGISFPPELLARFEPIRVLGQGGYGTAILANVKDHLPFISQQRTSSMPLPLPLLPLMVVVKVVKLQGLNAKRVSMAINEAHTLAIR